MKVTCPSCTKSLAVGDDSAGRRVKCPACQEVFRVPEAAPVVVAPVAVAPVVVAPVADDDVDTEISDRPLPSKGSAATPAALKTGKPPKPARRPCPECGASLAPGATECSECDWTEEPVKKSKSSRRSEPAEDGQGRCYIHIRKDDVELNQAIEKRMEKLIETEQLDMQVMDYRDEPPDELGPNDLVINGRVNVADYGSQFVRYFLTFIAMLGPGSCKLEVEADIETADDGKRPLSASSRQWIGLFGGTGTGLMKINVAAVAGRIANRAARQITGRSFLNYYAYLCGYWSLGLGLASLIPFIGIVLAPIGIICGLIAFVTISRRDLPRGKVVAICGLVFGFLGFVISVAIILVQMLQR